MTLTGANVGTMPTPTTSTTVDPFAGLDLRRLDVAERFLDLVDQQIGAAGEDEQSDLCEMQDAAFVELTALCDGSSEFARDFALALQVAREAARTDHRRAALLRVASAPTSRRCTVRPLRPIVKRPSAPEPTEPTVEWPHLPGPRYSNVHADDNAPGWFETSREAADVTAWTDRIGIIVWTPTFVPVTS